MGHVPGKAILVSGHDMVDLKALLDYIFASHPDPSGEARPGADGASALSAKGVNIGPPAPSSPARYSPRHRVRSDREIP